MFYTYKRIPRVVYDYCIDNKIVDAALIAKWKKSGYERLCSTYVINPRNYKFGTVSICRVPAHCLSAGQIVEDPTTGCRGCASGPGGQKNIFGSKYGQYLAAIQVAREDRQKELEEKNAAFTSATNDNSEDSDEDYGPVGAADGSSGPKSKGSVWAGGDEEAAVEVTALMGEASAEADREARSAAKHAQGASEGAVSMGPPGKRMRT
jgi:hypothetical protein